MKKISWCLLILACVSCTSMNTVIFGIDPNNTEKNPRLSGWADFNKLSLRLNPERNDFLYLNIENYRNNESKIEMENAKQKGTVLIINNQYMLTHGFDLRSGYESDILDEPLSIKDLIFKLLYSTYPKGPPAKKGYYPIAHIDNFHSIHVKHESASKDFLAPWDIMGNINCTEPGSLSFSFSANFKSEERPWDIRGEWFADAKVSSLPDDMPLDGWGVYMLGTISREIKGESNDVFGATPASNFKTLGEIRKSLKEKSIKEE